MKPVSGYAEAHGRRAGKMLTDPGGVQKEAYMPGVPCVTLRENTEWVEALEGGGNGLVGTDRGKIVRALTGFQHQGTQKRMFGDGDASARIREMINSRIV